MTKAEKDALRVGKHGAHEGTGKYSILSPELRRLFRGSPLAKQLRPRNEAEEKIAADFFATLDKLLTTYARKMARRAVEKIGRA